ncbi:NlpC/P60 family protein [Flavobacterium coralii]|uniref:C40 family peptidase n=1 Tax=Flavobacterium coralii TaxID=2838017 RepID=UPI0032B11956
MKKLLPLSLFFLMMVSFTTSAQIVTSKKEAQKKGIYSYSEKESNTDNAVAVATEKPSKPTQGPAQPVITVKNEETVAETAPEVQETTVTEKKDKKKKKRVTESQRPDPDYIPAPYENYLAMQIVNNAMEFEGVNYRSGGTTKDGMDCSGMVYTTFNIFDISLPRSSYEMAKAGRKIDLSEVRKGDLLFFDNNPRRKRINHVGLVTEVTEDGEIKFIHATLQLGVVVSSMSETYYDKTFVQANRVIEDDF